MRTTGARRPENPKKHNAIAPTNTISRKDVERHARLTEANGLPRPVAKTYSRKNPQVYRSEKHSRHDLSYKDSQRRSITMRIDAATIVMKSRAYKHLQRFPPPPPFCVSVHSTMVMLEMRAKPQDKRGRLAGTRPVDTLLRKLQFNSAGAVAEGRLPGLTPRRLANAPNF